MPLAKVDLHYPGCLASPCTEPFVNPTPRIIFAFVPFYVFFTERLIKLGLSIDEDDAAADDGEDDIPDLDDAEGDEESTMEQVD